VDLVGAVEVLAAAEPGEAGDAMKLQDFFSGIDEKAIVAAIGEAEKRTSGQIRVFVSHHKVQDAVAAAQKHFLRLGMDQTRHRNAVLLFVAPRSHQFAIIGDQGVHEKCGEEFWTRVAGEMSGRFKESRWTEAIVHGVNAAGAALAEHFPKDGNGGNELADGVEKD
jgi:uncharacterized membrane protein